MMLSDKLQKEKLLTRKMFSLSWLDLLMMVALLLAAIAICALLFFYTGTGSNSALIFVLAVTLISRYTTGYLPGMIASLASAFFINYYFTYPYSAFTLSLSGYPVAFFSVISISLIISTMTTQIKRQAEQARERELQTKSLYALNERLSAERTNIKIEAETERMRGNLLRAVSHDLRTPLTAILGASSVILEDVDRLGKKEVQRLAEDIKTDSEWLIRMVENLLSVTRMTGGDAPKLKKLQEPAEEIVAAAIAKVKRNYPGCRIKVHVPDEYLLIPMDAMLIEQVLINLFENSLRHSGSDDEIELTVESREPFVYFIVRDSGCGISPDLLPHLFEGINLGDDHSSDASRGMGIGLSVCRSIVVAHGGVIEARNIASGGAEFRFALPLEEKHEQ